MTYSLGGTDGASFSMLRNTGQLQTKAALNREVQDTYMVTVTATDPSGLSATVNVTIKVTNVDEDPTLTGPASPRVAENIPTTTAVATYVAMDDEDDNTGTAIRWSLAGTDAADFSITGGVLRFKSAPNYEADSTYNITVQASDSDEATTPLMAVTVTVTNEDEAGTLTLSTLQPVDGIELTTTLTDIDGVRTVLRMSPISGPSPPGGRAPTPSSKGRRASLLHAKTCRRKPLPARHGDLHRPQGAGKTARWRQRLTGCWPRGARTPPLCSRTPMTMKYPTAQAFTREVAENTPKGVAVGAPVVATDSEGDVLTYTLGDGNDASVVQH